MPRTMAKKRKEAEELILTKKFPPGTIIRPKNPQPVQVIPPRPKIVCRWCESERVERTSSSGRKRFYRCFSCVDPETMAYTVFTVISKSA